MSKIVRVHQCPECSSSSRILLVKGERYGWTWEFKGSIDFGPYPVPFWFCPFCHVDLGDLKNSEVLT